MFMQWVDKHPVWWGFGEGPFPLACTRDKGEISITIYEISGWRDVKISMLHPFEAAYGPWLSYSRDWSLSPLTCKIANWKSSVLCQVNVSCPFLVLVKSSFAERRRHVLTVRAAWCECHEELGTSLDPELCTGRAAKGGGIPQSSLK